jgi:1-acyl-sn-glycerol-3-phosphate acyltransferase
MEPIYRPIALLLKAIVRVMGWRLLLSGQDRIPPSGPAVLACNHISYIDPVMIGLAADRQGRLIRFLAKIELFEIPIWGRMMRQMRHIAVDRHGAGGGTAFEQAVDRLRSGYLVGVWPEATISTSFVPAEGKTGAARMAMAAGVPLVPVGLWGGQRIHTKNRPRTMRRGVALAVRVGAPVAYEPDEDPGVVTDRLMAAIAELVEQAAATYPQRPSGPDDTWWLPRHLGGTAPSVEEAAAARAAEREAKRARRAARGPRG